MGSTFQYFALPSSLMGLKKFHLEIIPPEAIKPWQNSHTDFLSIRSAFDWNSPEYSGVMWTPEWKITAQLQIASYICRILKFKKKEVRARTRQCNITFSLFLNTLGISKRLRFLRAIFSLVSTPVKGREMLSRDAIAFNEADSVHKVSGEQGLPWLGWGWPLKVLQLRAGGAASEMYFRNTVLRLVRENLNYFCMIEFRVSVQGYSFWHTFTIELFYAVMLEEIGQGAVKAH